jgi:hypothetical protein
MVAVDRPNPDLQFIQMVLLNSVYSPAFWLTAQHVLATATVEEPGPKAGE